MRKEYHEKLKQFFRNKLLLTRKEMNITQEQMSERLSMSLRSYSDLETGKSSCGAMTLALFLVYFCPNPKEFLSELKELYKVAEDETKDF